MNEFVNGHTALLNILQSRGIEKPQRNYPLWKFKLTDEEYECLKQTLIIGIKEISFFMIP